MPSTLLSLSPSLNMSRESVPEGSLDYELIRLEWRAGLTEQNCRSMAADYLRGQRDQANTDAYQEYMKRGYGNQAKKSKDRKRWSGFPKAAKGR